MVLAVEFCNKISLFKSIKTLEEMPKLKDKFSNYKYFKGVTGIKAMWFELVKNLDEDSHIDLISSKDKMIQPFEKIFIEIHKLRVEKKITMNILFPEGITDIAKTRKKLGLVNLRELKLNNQAEIAVTPNSIIINYLGLEEGGPRAMYIEDKIFVNFFKLIFDNFWNQAKKI